MAFNPKIKMSFQYPGRKPVLFRSATRGRNDILLVLTNSGKDALTLKAGATTIALNLRELCGDDELAELRLTADGWDSESDSDGPTLSPVDDIRWGKQETLTFAMSFGTLGIGSKLGDKHVQVTMKKIWPAVDGPACPSKTLDDFMVLVDKPEKSDPDRLLIKALSFEISSPTILTSVGRDYLISNDLVLTIRNRDKDKPLHAGGDGPTFTLVFPSAVVEEGDEEELTGSTALTTARLAQAIHVKPVGDGKHRWIASGPDSGSLVCEVKPEEGNHELIDKGGALELHISNLQSNLPPFATQIYVLYGGFDGYDPGYETLELSRQIPEPQVKSFLAEPPSLYCGEESRWSWEVLGCDRVELFYVEYGIAVRKSSARGNPRLGLPKDDLTVTPYQDTVYTLSLYKNDQLVREATVAVNVVMPEMDFRMTPPAAALDERAMLSWTLTGRWGFEGKITEGRTVLQKISKPATDVPLRGNMSETVRQNRFYRLSGVWATPDPLPMEAEATLSVVEPVASINYFRMYRTVDRVFGDISFAWSGRNVERYMIGHCAAGSFPGADRLGTLTGDDTTVFDVFTMIEIDWSNTGTSVTVPMAAILGWYGDEGDPTLDWCNESLAQRDFYLMAFDQQGTSAVPVISAATIVPRAQEL